MYSFSRVQRNFSDKKTLSLYIVIGSLALLYPTMIALYPLLPPLLGLGYVKWRQSLYRYNFVGMAGWMLYALVFETVWGLPLYGIWTTMFVTFALFDPKVTFFLRNRHLIDIISVVIFNFVYLFFILFYEELAHEKLFEMDLIFLYYLLVDIAGVILF